MFTSCILFHLPTLLPQPDIMHLKLFFTVQLTFIEHQLCARHHARMNEDFITSFKELHLARSLLKAFCKLPSLFQIYSVSDKVSSPLSSYEMVLWKRILHFHVCLPTQHSEPLIYLQT